MSLEPNHPYLDPDPDDDRDDYDPPCDEDGFSKPDGCVLGAACCCPHLFHGPDECFTAEWAAEYFGDLGGEGG